MSMLSSRWTYILKFVYAPFWMLAMGLTFWPVFGEREFRGANGESPPELFPWIFGAVWALANPDSNQLTQIPLGWLRMPNLGLKDREIASLVAMINSGGREISAR